MRYLGIIVAVVVIALAVSVARPKEEAKPVGLLAPLEKGQQVSLKEVAGGWRIEVLPGLPLGHTVTEVGTDYLVVQDVAGVSEYRIPATAIKAVVITRLKR